MQSCLLLRFAWLYISPLNLNTMEVQIINNRIEMLDLAESLALQDSDPKNMDENMNMVFRCIAGKAELMNIKNSLISA